MRVLIVEDEKGLAESMRRGLLAEGLRRRCRPRRSQRALGGLGV